MSRHDEIQNAYKYLGKEATFYDGMITCSTISGSAVCKDKTSLAEIEKMNNNLFFTGMPEIPLC